MKVPAYALISLPSLAFTLSATVTAYVPFKYSSTELFWPNTIVSVLPSSLIFPFKFATVTFWAVFGATAATVRVTVTELETKAFKPAVSAEPVNNVEALISLLNLTSISLALIAES